MVNSISALVTTLKTEKSILLVTVGSVDGVSAAAAILCLLGKRAAARTKVIFTQAFQVGAIQPETWEKSSVVFVDLAVNNADPTMTEDFVQRVEDAGHKIVAVLDEHDAQLWEQVMGDRFINLLIKPVSAKNDTIKSTCALIWNHMMGGRVDKHLSQLLLAGDAGDKMNFSTHFGGLINAAVKSAIADNSRREHLARHFAFHSLPDEKIQVWLDEYQEILKNHKEILSAQVQLEEGVVIITTGSLKIDATTLFNGLYKGPAKKFVIIRGMMFNPGKKTMENMVSIASGNNSLDFVQCLKDAGLQILGGKGSKVNLAPEYEEEAVKAIKKAFFS